MNKGLLRGQHAVTAPALLAATVYGPNPNVSYTTTSSTSSDVDAANLKVTFTAPASGKCMVRLTAYMASVGSDTYPTWNLRDANGDIPNTKSATNGAVPANSVQLWQSLVIQVTGLTPGQTYTWKWGWSRNTGTSTPTFYAGSTANVGPAAMEVYALP